MKFDAKTVIHDYGFGGAGMSLAWGCGAMAADMALEQGDRRAAVLGCGSPGLTAARQLQRRGFDRHHLRAGRAADTTSNMSSAGFTPTAGLVSADQRHAGMGRAVQAGGGDLIPAAAAAAPATPVTGSTGSTTTTPRTISNPPRGRKPDGDLVPEHLRIGRGPRSPRPGRTSVSDQATPFARTALAIEPSIYLDALVRDFVLFGGKIVIRKFDTPRDLMSLTEPVIVNCTGLGSKTLFNDDELVPIRGTADRCCIRSPR